MMKKALLLLTSFLLAAACSCEGGKVAGEDPSSDEATPSEDVIPSAEPSKEPVPVLKPVDKDATAQTVALYSHLADLAGKGIMFGAQIPTEYGLSGGKRWTDDGSISQSDTKILTGKHPAVCGWDISEIELDHETNIDGEPFTVIRKHIEAAYRRGAVNTISWHVANPVTGGNSWDNIPAVHTIIPGGENHELFKTWLDKVAAFLGSIKGPAGEAVPLIFRPFHEHTGNGFWWGKGSASSSDFVALWRFTVTYLRDVKGLHNLLLAYSPDEIHFIWDGEEKYPEIYLEFWPGDSYVDILGLDAYDADGRRYAEVTPVLCRMIKKFADAKVKVAALTETGIENNSPEHSSYYNKQWWTCVLHATVHGAGLSFALVWRNGGLPPQSHYFNAWKGCYSEEDFVTFAAMSDVLLEDDIPDMYSL